MQELKIKEINQVSGGTFENDMSVTSACNSFIELIKFVESKEQRSFSNEEKQVAMREFERALNISCANTY